MRLEVNAGELREKYAEVFGEVTTSRHKEFLLTAGGCEDGRGLPPVAGGDTDDGSSTGPTIKFAAKCH